MESKIRGEAAIRSMKTSEITELIKSMDLLREGRVNIRDLDRRDIQSINVLMTAYGLTQ